MKIVRKPNEIITDFKDRPYLIGEGWVEVPDCGMIKINGKPYIHYFGMCVPFEDALHRQMKILHPEFASQFEGEFDF